MRIRIEKQNDRLELPDDFAQLEKIEKDGTFVYRFKYEAKIGRILGRSKSRQSIRVNIRVLKNTSIEKRVRIFDKGFKPEDIVKRLRFKMSLQRQLMRRRKKLRLKEKRSDISKRIPNSETYRISGLRKGQKERLANRRRNSQKSHRKDTKRIMSFTKRFEHKVKSIQSLKAGDKLAPILDANLNKEISEQETQATTRLIRRESMRLLYLSKGDPGEWSGRKTRTIAPARKQHRGISSKPSFFLKNNSDPLLRRKMDTLVKSYLTKTKVAHHEELIGAKFVNVMQKIEDDVVRIEEIIKFEPGIIDADTFVVQFDLVNNKGLLIQRESRVVRHAKNVALLQRPVVPPKISVAPFGKKGRSLITLKQLDDNATKIAVYKKEANASRFNLNNEFEQIEIVDATKNDPEVYVEDFVFSNNPIIYRAVPIGVNGDLGAEFNSFVVKNERIATGAKENYLRRPCFLSLYNEIDGRTNTLFIDNIPNEPISLEVYRRDVELKENWRLVNEPIYLETNADRPLEIDDDGLKINRIYEYKVMMLFADGAKVDAGNRLLIKFTPIESNVVNLKIENLAWNQDDDVVDVTFDINKSAINKDLDSVKQALRSQEIDEYDEDIKDKKENLQDLFFIRVLRTNLSSGEVEDFGIVEAESFSDRDLGPIKNVSELEVGNSYKYAVIAYARAAETLIPDYTRAVNSGSINQYTLKPGKYLHPITLGEAGSIVTNSSLKRNHASSAFTQGKVVDIQYVDVDLANFLPKIQEAKAAVVNSKRTLLQWRVKGDPSLIDHFIVVLEINAMRTIVGKSHAVGGDNTFEFVDILDNGEHGALEYILIPVYYDYSRGAELRLDAIFI